MQRQRVKSTESFSANTPVAWQESYGYRLDSGRLHTRTTSSQGGPLVPLTHTYAYDRYYGYLSAVTYPNAPQPLTVWKRYTRYGALAGLVDARMMTPLWSMSQADAYGKPTQEQFGYALSGTTGYSRSTGQMLGQAWTPFERPTFPGPVETIAYGYDVLGNLASQERRWRRYDVGRQYANVLLDTGTSTTYLGASKERYRYDGLQRLLSVDRSTGTGTALANPFPYGPTTSIAYQYDAVGNIRSKSDFADSYTYGLAATPGAVGTGGACGPSALWRTVDTPNNLIRDYRCDSNGNQVGETMTGDRTGTRSVVFDGANLPTKIDHTDPWPVANTLGGHVSFAYGPDNARYRRSESSGLVIHYGADGYEQQVSHSQVLHRIDLGPVLYTRVVTPAIANPAEVAYLLRDRLGSTIGMADRWGDFNTTETGVPFDTSNAEGHLRRFYDPFGSPARVNFTRNTAMPELRWNPTSQTYQRGFTGHEHLDGARLIHMNGRTFDYRSGRFLSVDPLIQAPANSQSLNPYSYVFNNPLSGTDPSGYKSCSQTTTEESDVGTECTTMAKDPRSANKLGTMVTVRVGADAPTSNGSDAVSVQGASSTPANRQNAPSDIGGTGKSIGQRVSHFLMPHTAEMGERGAPGTWGESASGAGKAIGNTGITLSQMLNPMGLAAAMLGYPLPTMPIADTELSGASAVETGTLVAGPIMRGVGMLRSLATVSSALRTSFFRSTRLEAEALQMQGLSRSEAFTKIRSFNAGNPDGYTFHFTTPQGGRGILNDGVINPSTSGIAGPGVYTGTTPTPNWFTKNVPFLGWGLGGKGANVRIPVQMTQPGAAPWLPPQTRVFRDPLHVGGGN